METPKPQNPKQLKISIRILLFVLFNLVKNIVKYVNYGRMWYLVITFVLRIKYLLKNTAQIISSEKHCILLGLSISAF